MEQNVNRRKLHQMDASICQRKMKLFKTIFYDLNVMQIAHIKLIK